MCRIIHELVGRLEPNLHVYDMEHYEDLINFDGPAIIFKDTAVKSNQIELVYMVCGGKGVWGWGGGGTSVFSENNLSHEFASGSDITLCINP